MIRFGVVGAGWRARFFLKIARACPDRFEVTGIVTRDRKRAAKWLPPYDVPLFKSLDDLIETRPQFVVTSVPWGVNPSLLTALANKDMPALSETPPATTLEEMIDLWHLVEYGAKIAVFEQYPCNRCTRHGSPSSSRAAWAAQRLPMCRSRTATTASA